MNGNKNDDSMNFYTKWHAIITIGLNHGYLLYGNEHYMKNGIILNWDVFV